MKDYENLHNSMKIRFTQPCEIGLWYPLFKLPSKTLQVKRGQELEVKSVSINSDFGCATIHHENGMFTFNIPTMLFESVD